MGLAVNAYFIWMLGSALLSAGEWWCCYRMLWHSETHTLHHWENQTEEEQSTELWSGLTGWAPFSPWWKWHKKRNTRIPSCFIPIRLYPLLATGKKNICTEGEGGAAAGAGGVEGGFGRRQEGPTSPTLLFTYCNRHEKMTVGLKWKIIFTSSTQCPRCCTICLGREAQLYTNTHKKCSYDISVYKKYMLHEMCPNQLKQSGTSRKHQHQPDTLLTLSLNQRGLERQT